MIITVARMRDNIVINIEVMPDTVYAAYVGEDRLVPYTEDNPAVIGGGIIDDRFYCPSPFPSWTLNESTCRWDAPIAYPTDGKTYNWNEASLSWASKGVTQ